VTRFGAGWRRLLWPGLLALAVLAILVGLGVWQVDRLAWKRTLLARIAAAEQAPPVALGPQPAPYSKVEVTGELHPELAVLYGVQVRETATGSGLGAQLIVPMERQDAAPVLIDLGWVPRSSPVPIDLDRSATVTGFVRPPDRRGWFTPADDVPGRHFYRLDPAAIGQTVGLPTLAPFIVVALGPPASSGYPDPARTLPRPPNDHLSYAATWFSLAAALVVGFAVWSRKALRA
jgi:surfeit locus 1 family protein